MDCNNEQMSNVNISGGILNSITISNNMFIVDNDSITCISNNMIVDFSLATLVFRNHQISGDKINGGTIDDISISKLGGSMNCNTELMSNVNISGGIVNYISISNSDIFMLGKTIDLSGSNLILKDNEISGDKINGGTIDNITISEIHGPIDFCNQLMTNVNLSGGIINDVAGTLGNIVFTPDSLLDLQAANIIFAPNQLSGDSIGGGTISGITISNLLGAMNCNTQAMTNVNIVSGNLTGVTINGTITIATLDGAMNANNQFISNVNIDSGDISNVNITANSIISSGSITGSSFAIGSANISEAELETIDGITPGTAAASKALVLDSNLNISGIRNITSTGVLDVGNSDLKHYIGKAAIGYLGSTVHMAGFAHRDHASDTNYAMKQDINGGVFLNAPTEKKVRLGINGGETVLVDNSGIGVTGTITASTTIKALDISVNRNLDVSDNLTVSGSIIANGSITGGSFVIGSANISETELETIDGITPGTAAASKALVVDSNLNISGIRNITSTGVLDVGNSDLKHYIGKAAIGYLGSTVHMAGFAHRDHASDTNYAMKQDINGGVFLNAPTEKKVRLGINGGETVLVDNSGIGVTGTITASTTIKALDISVNRNLDVSDNLTVSGSIIANGSITGGSFVIGSANISETELETIDGITPGTAAASKALVVDGNVDIAGLRNITATGSFGCGTITTTGQINGPSTLIIDPAGIGDNTGLVVIRGGLQIDGSSTIINSSTLDISDHRILLSSSATNQSQTYGAGIEVSGNKTFKYVNGDVWESNIDLSARGITTTILRATNIDLSLQSLLDTSAAHFTEINANTTLLSATLGIASASKALVVDSNVDISGIRNITTSGSIKGLDISVNRNLDVSNNLTVSGSIIVNGSITGSSFVIGSANITEAELEKIDNISDGSVSSSKAVVVDDNKDIGGFNLLSAITLSGENINIKGKDLYNILDFFLELDSFTS